MLKNIRNKLLTVASNDGTDANIGVTDADAPVSGFVCPECRMGFDDPDALQLHFVSHLESDEANARKEESASKRPSIPNIFKTKTEPQKHSTPTSTFYSGEKAEDFVCPMCTIRLSSPDELQEHFDQAHVALEFEPEVREVRKGSALLVEGIQEQDKVVKNLIQENKELKVSLEEEKWYVEELKKELEKYEASNVLSESSSAAMALPEEDQKLQERKEGEELEEKNKNLQSQLEENMQHMESLRVSKEVMERKAAELASSVVEFKAKADEADTMKAAMQDEMKELLLKLEETEGLLEKRGSEDDTAILKQELVSIQNMMDKQVQALNEQIQEKDVELAAFTSASEETETSLKATIQELENRITTQRQEMLKKAEETLQQKNDEAEMEAVKILKEELALKETELTAKKTKVEQLVTKIDALQAELKSSETEAKAVRKSLENEKETMATLEQKLEDMTKANEEMGEKYLRAQEESNEKESNVLTELHELKETNAKIKEEKTRLENKLEDKRRNERLINQKLAELEMTKQEQHENISKLEENQKDHESQVAEWSSREIAMESALLQKEGVQRDLQKQVEVLTIRHTEAQSQVSSLEVQHQEMQNRIKDFEKGMESLEKELETTKAAFEETKKQEAETQKRFNLANEDKKAFEDKLLIEQKTHDEELNLLREAKHVLISDKVEIGRRVEKIEADLQIKRQDMETLLAETSQQRDRLDSEIKRLKGDLDGNSKKWQTEEDNLKVELSVKDTKLSLLLENVSTLEGELQSLDKSKDDAWSEKLEIEAKVSILQDEKRLLGERCISAESQIDEQKNRIRSLVSQCESLQCALEELGRENQTLQVKQSQIQSRKWTEDSDILACSSCTKSFSLTVRKHHCRNCGSVFCAECTENTAEVPSFKKPQRVCEICYNELRS